MRPWCKDVVTWKDGKTLYVSVPFTWLLPKAEVIAREHKGKVVAGGPAVNLMGAPWADEVRKKAPIDVLRRYNPDATFTTRGCIRACKFCAVPKTEGKFRELKTWKVRPLVCDNQILAASNRHFGKVINSLIRLPHIDFNQGLDARLFTAYHAFQLSRLNWVRVRFAFDHVNMETKVASAIERARRCGLKHFGVYVLVGFKDNLDEALYKLETVRSWRILPNPMRYQPLDCMKKNSHVAPGWDKRMLAHVMRYYSRLHWLRGVKFEQYVDYMETKRKAK